MKIVTGSTIVTLMFLISSCTGSLPEISSAHVSWASQRWPGVSSEDLGNGRRLYILKCSGCHSLHAPDELSPQQWAKAVPEMIVRTKMTKEEAELIVRYLTTILETKEDESRRRAERKESTNHE